MVLITLLNTKCNTNCFAYLLNNQVSLEQANAFVSSTFSVTTISFTYISNANCHSLLPPSAIAVQ